MMTHPRPSVFFHTSHVYSLKDLEYIKSYNPNLTDDQGDLLVEEFISELCVEVKCRFNLEITRKNIVDLVSSTDKKFSRHLIVHFPEGRLFSNCCSCGRFVKSFIGRLAEEVATGEMSSRHPTLSQYLFVWKEDRGDCLSSEELAVLSGKDRNVKVDKKKTCFVDLGTSFVCQAMINTSQWLVPGIQYNIHLSRRCVYKKSTV